jgi:hypothetical protein
MNHSSIRFPVCSRASPSIRSGRVFEPRLRHRIGLGVDRPGLLPGEVKPLEQPEHPGLAVADAEATLDHIAQVAGAPGDAAVLVQVRAAQDKRLERSLLALVQGTGTAGSRPVPQALDTLLVVAVDPVAKCLPGHPREPRCFLARQAVECVGQSKQAGADPTVALAAGEPAQLGCIMVGVDRQG